MPRLDMSQFLTVAVNALDSYFFRAPKEKARRLYKDIAEGDAVGVATLSFGENKEQTVRLKLSLDQSEFRGHLTFHLFQQALDMLLKNLAGRIQNKQDLNIFTSEETSEILVHIPGLVEDGGNVNVLVLGLAPVRGGALIKLQFLDPEQFKKQVPAPETGSAAPEATNTPPGPEPTAEGSDS